MHSIRMMNRCCACVRLYVNVFWMVTSNWSLRDSLIILQSKERDGQEGESGACFTEGG